MIDLHSHTTASDGQHSPAELLGMAKAAGVTTLAVTDHDTVAALGVCADEARALGLRFVPGIEISAYVYGKEVHVLGHFVRADEEALASFSVRLRDERHVRMEQMVQKMRAIGYPIRMSEVETLAGDANLGRPHLARVLVEKGWCLDVKEAFDRFLGDGKPGWVDRFRLDCTEAVKLIRDAGGTATVAHPAVSKIDRHELRPMVAAGLAGLEVHHSDQDPGIRERLLAMAREFDLIPTAGSDFHGEKIAPGRRLGTAAMDPAAFDALRARATDPAPFG